MDRKKLLVLAVVAAAIVAFFVFDLKQYLSLEFFQASRARIDAFYASHPWQTAGAFVVESALLYLIARRRLGLHMFVWQSRQR